MAFATIATATLSCTAVWAFARAHDQSERQGPPLKGSSSQPGAFRWVPLRGTSFRSLYPRGLPNLLPQRNLVTLKHPPRVLTAVLQTTEALDMKTTAAARMQLRLRPLESDAQLVEAVHAWKSQGQLPVQHCRDSGGNWLWPRISDHCTRHFCFWLQ